MITVLVYLFILLAVILVSILLIEVLLKALEKQPDLEKDSIGETLSALFTQLFLLVVVVGSALLASGVGFADHATSWWKVYLGICVSTGFVVMWVHFHPELIQTADAGVTKFWVPFYRFGVLNVANFLRVVYKITVCWINLLNGLYRIIYANIILISFDCTTANWQLIVDRAVIAIQQPFISLTLFISSGGQDDFDLTTPIEAFSNYTLAWGEVLDCICLDLQLFWNVPLRSFASPNFGPFIDRFFNFVIESFRFWINPIIDVRRDSDFFDCSSEPTETLEIQCLSERPPDVDKAGDDLCLWLLHLFDWIDDTIEIIFDELFNVAGLGIVRIPRFGPFFHQPWCIGVKFIGEAFDIITHIDLVFRLDPPVRYLQFIDLDRPFSHWYNLTNGIQDFFDAFNDTVASDFGCILAEAWNVTGQSSELSLRVIIQLTVDPLNILDYLENNPKHLALDNGRRNDINDTFDCAESLATQINKPLGQVVLETTHVLIAFDDIWVDLINHVPTFPTYIATANITALNDKLWFEMEALGIAMGNFWRQFTIIDPNECPLRDAHDLISKPPDHVDFFCCVGGTVEAFWRSMSRSLRIISETIGAVVLSSSTIELGEVLENGGDNLQLLIDTQFAELIRATACILPSLVRFDPSGDQCPIINSEDLHVEAQQVIVAALNFTTLPIRIVALSAQSFGIVLQTNPLNICEILLKLFDMTIGISMKIFKEIADLLDCLEGSDEIGLIANFLWNELGWDNPTNFRGMLCDNAQTIIDAVECLLLLFTDPDAFFQKILDEIGDEFLVLLAILQNLFVNNFNLVIVFLNDLSDFICCIIVRLDVLRQCLFDLILIVDAIRIFLGCILTCIINLNVNCKCGGVAIPTCSAFNTDLFSCPGNIIAAEKCSGIVPLPPSTLPTVPTTFAKKSEIPETMQNLYEEDENNIDHHEMIKKDSIVKRQEENTISSWLFPEINIHSENFPCKEQFIIVRNPSLDPNIKNIVIQDAKRCLISAVVARFGDTVLLNNNETYPLFNPYILYDSSIGFSTLFNITSAMYSIYDYRIHKNRMNLPFFGNQTYFWKNYTSDNNITDRLTVRIGRLSDIIFTLFNYAEFVRPRNSSEPRNLIGGLYRLLVTSYDYTIGLFTRSGGFIDIYNRYKNRTSEASTQQGGSISKKNFILWDGANGDVDDKENGTGIIAMIFRIPFHPELHKAHNTSASILVSWFNKPLDWWKTMNTIEDERILRNRWGIKRVFTRFVNRVQWNLNGRPSDGEFAFYPTPIVKRDCIIEQLANERRFDKRGVIAKKGCDLLGTGDLCIGDDCFNCTLAQSIVNDVVDLICFCIEDSLEAIDIARDIFTSQQYVSRSGAKRRYRNGVGPPLPILSPEDKLVKKQKIREEFISARVHRGERFSFTTWAFDQIEKLFELIIGEIDFEGFLTDIVMFFTNFDRFDKGSVFFWFFFITICDPVEHTRCDMGDEGLGLGTSLWVNISIFGGLIIIGYLLSDFIPTPSGTIMVFLGGFMLLIVFYSTLIFAYFMSPACFIPIPLLIPTLPEISSASPYVMPQPPFLFLNPIPLLPDCLADDVFAGLVKIDSDCIPWENLRPGLTQEECPTEADDFKREFPDCSAEPFHFVDASRNLFFFLEWQIPRLAEFIRTTKFIFVGFMREINYLDDSMTFDDSVRSLNGEIDDTFVWCWYISSPNWAPWALAAIEVGAFSFYFFAFFWLLFITLISILSLILLTIMLFVSRIGRLGANRDRYYISVDELPIISGEGFDNPNIPASDNGPSRRTMSDSMQQNLSSQGVYRQADNNIFYRQGDLNNQEYSHLLNINSSGYLDDNNDNNNNYYNNNGSENSDQMYSDKKLD